MYKAIAFDFDGTLVESLDIKTRAFRQLFKDHPRHVDEIVSYHCRFLGLSRFIKLEHIYKNILGKPLSKRQLLREANRFGRIVKREVVQCPFVSGALPLLKSYVNRVPLYVLSATPGKELQSIVIQRGLKRYFAGIFGAPLSKDQALRKIAQQNHIPLSQVLYVGDALTDWKAARKAGVNFIGRRVKNNPYPFPARVRQIHSLRDLSKLLKRSVRCV